MRTVIGSRPTALVVATLLALAGCGGGEDVTVASLRQARQTWNRANIQDYDLEWTSSGGPSPGHYLVTVRGGRVERVRSALPDGRVIEARPGDKQLYGVDGLFRILERELDLAADDRPFGQPRGATVILQFAPDDRYGFPRSYRRDVSGATGGVVAIDVLRFEPEAPAAPVPPRPAA